MRVLLVLVVQRRGRLLGELAVLCAARQRHGGGAVRGHGWARANPSKRERAMVEWRGAGIPPSTVRICRVRGVRHNGVSRFPSYTAAC